VGCADEPGELLLGEPCPDAKRIDLLRDLSIERGLGQCAQPNRAATEVAAIEDRERVRGAALAFGSQRASRCVCGCGSASKACFRRRARSISVGGTAAACLMIPCEITTACCLWKK